MLIVGLLDFWIGLSDRWIIRLVDYWIAQIPIVSGRIIRTVLITAADHGRRGFQSTHERGGKFWFRVVKKEELVADCWIAGLLDWWIGGFTAFPCPAALIVIPSCDPK